MRTFQRTLERTGVLQVDSVNVLQRAHFMPLYSRMGPYDVDLLRRAAEQRPRRVVEYWAHVQAFMPVELWPVMQHRMEDHRAKRGKWGFVADNDTAGAQPARRGPGPGCLDRPRPGRGPPAGQGPVGLELVGDPPDARLPVHRRRPRDRRAQQPVRDPLRPARAGDPGPRAGSADPDPRGVRARAGTPCRPLPRGRDRAGPARLLPDAGGRHRDGGRRPGRGGRAAPGVRGRLEAARLPAPRRPAAPTRSPPGPCSARSTRSSGSGPGPRRSSTSATASRSTSPPRSGSTATTCCRSCSATGSSPGSTSRPTGGTTQAPGGSSCRRRTPSRTPPRRPRRSSRPSCGRLAGWLGLGSIRIEPRGDLAPALRTLGLAG